MPTTSIWTIVFRDLRKIRKRYYFTSLYYFLNFTKKIIRLIAKKQIYGRTITIKTLRKTSFFVLTNAFENRSKILKKNIFQKGFAETYFLMIFKRCFNTFLMF